MQIERIRRFNRYYSRVLGIFGRRYLGVDFSVTEVRILGEIGRNSELTAQMLAEYLELDKGYLSRLMRRLETDSLIERRRSEEDGRKLVLTLTERGAAVNAELERRANERIGAQLAGLDEESRRRLLTAMEEIQSVLRPIVSEYPKEGGK